MSRFSVALVTAAMFSACGQASEFRAWSSGDPGSAGHELATIQSDPWNAWTDGSSTPPMVYDAYVFADVVHGPGLSRDVVVAAVRFDIERLARPALGAMTGAERKPDAPGRVASTFERFVQVSQDGRAYASVEVAGGRGGPALLGSQAATEPAMLAMTSQER